MSNTEFQPIQQELAMEQYTQEQFVHAGISLFGHRSEENILPATDDMRLNQAVLDHLDETIKTFDESKQLKIQQLLGTKYGQYLASDLGTFALVRAAKSSAVPPPIRLAPFDNMYSIIRNGEKLDIEPQTNSESPFGMVYLGDGIGINPIRTEYTGLVKRTEVSVWNTTNPFYEATYTSYKDTKKLRAEDTIKEATATLATATDEESKLTAQIELDEAEGNIASVDRIRVSNLPDVDALQYLIDQGHEDAFQIILLDLRIANPQELTAIIDRAYRLISPTGQLLLSYYASNEPNSVTAKLMRKTVRSLNKSAVAASMPALEMDGEAVVVNDTAAAIYVKSRS
jgi:hypothetical protein